MKISAARGFTIIEVVVGAAVALLVIGIVMGTFLTQQRSLQAMDLSREASNGARDATFSMQQAIGRAGYGAAIQTGTAPDMSAAFDFKYYNCATVPCRDSITGPDEIVFVERDPNYYWAGNPTSVIQGCTTDTSAPCSGHAWPVTEFTDSTHIKINANAGDTFLLGQVILMTCTQGRQPTMGTVGATAKASAAGSLAITLVTPVAGNPYLTNVVTGANTCFGTVYGTAGALPGVSLFLVNRYRYFITTISGDPWLMLDRGLDYNQNGITPENGADPADYIPIARGAEDMQIAYLLRPPPSPWTGSGAAPTAPDLPAGSGDWIFGNVAGTAEEPNPADTVATQTMLDNDPLRFNRNPANIRGVRVRLTIRSLLKDLTVPNFAGDPYPASIENRNGFPVITDGFRRYQTSISVATPNMNSKDPFIF